MNSQHGLEFSFKEFQEEVQVMKELAEPLLTPKAVAALAKFETTVRLFHDQPTDRTRELQVEGVCTRSSAGEYEKGTRKGEDIFAELSSKWEVMPIGARGKKQPRPRFRLAGLASTRVSIRDPSGQILARWHMDIADRESPGCYFHIQVYGRPAGRHRESLPVPRFPNFLVTPMAALDFVLGELFEDTWLRRTSRGYHDAQRWRKIQKERWFRLLSWQLNHLRNSEENCSPWMSIKRAVPPSDLFLRQP